MENNFSPLVDGGRDGGGNIRPATRNDLPQILDIYNEVILNTTAVYSYEPHTLEMREAWFKERTENGFPVFVAEAENKIAGFCTYGHFRAWPAYKFTVESSVHIHADFRGKGIAKQLMQTLIAFAKAQGLHAMIAGIDADNKTSIALHKKLGFEITGNLKQVGYKFDRWLDLTFMELILETT
jgi:phosphinothricin acetyltransferase